MRHYPAAPSTPAPPPHISPALPPGASTTSGANSFPANFKGEPTLLSAHVYDPSSRLSIFYNPFERIAREFGAV
jgi:hypothetical protein